MVLAPAGTVKRCRAETTGGYFDCADAPRGFVDEQSGAAGVKSGNRVYWASYASNEPMLRWLPTADEWLGICVEALDEVVNDQNGESMWRLQTRDARDVHIGDGKYGRVIRAHAAYDFDIDPLTVVPGPGRSWAKNWLGTPHLKLTATCRQRHDTPTDADVLDIELDFYDHHDFSVRRAKRFLADTLTAIETTAATAMGPDLHRDGNSRYQLVSQTAVRRPWTAGGAAPGDGWRNWRDSRLEKAADEHTRNPPGPVIPPHVQDKIDRGLAEVGPTVERAFDKVIDGLGDSPAAQRLRELRDSPGGRRLRTSLGKLGRRDPQPEVSPEDVYRGASMQEIFDREHGFVHVAHDYQQVIDSGDPDWAPRAATALGDVRRRQNDFPGAAAAYQIAIDSGHPDEAPKAANSLGYLLETDLDDAVRAAAAYQIAVDSGHPDEAPTAARSLAMLLESRPDDFDGAAAAYQIAIDSGDVDLVPAAANDLGAMRQYRQHDFEGAAAAYQIAIDSGHPRQARSGAFRLGYLRESMRNDYAGAETAYQMSIDLGGRDDAGFAAITLGLLRETKLNDLAGAATAYQIAVDSRQHGYRAQGANRLGDLRKDKQFDLAGAAQAYRIAIDSGDSDQAPLGALSLGDVRRQLGDVAGAATAYQQAMDSGHSHWGPQAAERLRSLQSTSPSPESTGGRDRGPVDDAAPGEPTSTSQDVRPRSDSEVSAEEKVPKGQQRTGSRDRAAIDVGEGGGHLISSQLSIEDKVLIDQLLGAWRDCAEWARRCAGPLLPTGDDKEGGKKRARAIDYVVAKAVCEAGRQHAWEQLDAGEQARRIRKVTDARRMRNVVEHELAAARGTRLRRAAGVLAGHSQLLDSLSPRELVVTEEELGKYLSSFPGPSETTSKSRP
jgi:tetratricopeptide (TPR) repeat protein